MGTVIGHSMQTDDWRSGMVIEETGSIDLDKVLERGFMDKLEVQKAFKKKMETSGIQKSVVVNKRMEGK